tara:strand:- start:798 stop:1037 length:240 start_codon:yes stop_codon:yes gene_type:complete
MTHRFDEIKPSHTVSKHEVEVMIAAAIKQHNHNASIISMILGSIVLALFLDGLLRLLGVVPPFLGIDIDIIKGIVEKLT